MQLIMARYSSSSNNINNNTGASCLLAENTRYAAALHTRTSP